MRSGEIVKIFRFVRPRASRHFLVRVSPGSPSLNGQTRLTAVIVALKIDKRATRRNRLRRQAREIVRRWRERSGQITARVVVTVKAAPSPDVSFNQLETELIQALSADWSV